jgi:hypothetical protein
MSMIAKMAVPVHGYRYSLANLRGTMALLAFWKSSRDHVLGQTIHQIVSNAGDGKLRDGSECATELRQFLREVPSEHLSNYMQQCLDASFTDSGLVLQDIINEVGRRLDFDVENGMYRGKPSMIGFDGIWRSLDTPDILIEVKTTDYITIPLDKIADYKRRLVAEGRLASDASMLVIVGREDTGALEAQVRGSRHAWEMRLISAESLIKLVQIKEKSNEEGTIRQIRDLLQPFEYTKLDKIIDVIFATTEDVQQTVDAELEADEGDTSSRSVRTNRDKIDTKRQSAVDAIAKLKGVPLLKYRQTLFWSTDKSTRVCAAVSKVYERSYQPYWYAYHPQWDAFLKEGQNSYFVLACMDRDEAYAIPYDVLSGNLSNLNTTTRPNGTTYWHIALTKRDDGTLAWNISKAGVKLDLTPYKYPL